MRQYIVDAFTDEPFAGNPAAGIVVVLAIVAVAFFVVKSKKT